MFQKEINVEEINQLIPISEIFLNFPLKNWKKSNFILVITFYPPWYISIIFYVRYS